MAYLNELLASIIVSAFLAIVIPFVIFATAILATVVTIVFGLLFLLAGFTGRYKKLINTLR